MKIREQFEAHSDDLLNLVGGSFGVALNANDMFWYATACTIIVDPRDLHWVLPLYKEYGDDGLNACMRHIAGHDVLSPYKTPKYLEAYQKVIDLNPTVHSEF